MFVKLVGVVILGTVFAVAAWDGVDALKRRMKRDDRPRRPERPR